MRTCFAKVHLWLSIPFGALIAIICLSGAVLVFETEIQALCHPTRYFVKETQGKPLPPEQLIRRARTQLPDSIRINGIRVTSDPRRTYQLVLPGKKAACFIDPYTGEVTGIDNGQGFFMQTMRLHRWLLDSYKRDGGFSVGKTIVGYATLVLALILISGLAVWYPRNRKMLKSRLQIKTGAGWRRLVYDLHVAGGFYSAGVLLALTLTGLTWSFDWYREAFYRVCGVETTAAPAPSHTPATQKGDHPEREGRQKKRDYAPWGEVLSALQSRYNGYNAITIQDGTATVSTAHYGNTRASDRYTFDTATGKLTDVQFYKDQPASAKLRGWIYSVHAGTWGGLPTRILSCLASLLGGIFAITGYYLWIKKKRRKKRTPLAHLPKG